MIMENEAAPEIAGKKIFFLYPSPIMQNEVVAELVEQEFEVYIIRDHVNFRKILKQFPRAIVFVNIDEQLAEKEWEAWIRGIMNDPDTAVVGVGILSATANEALQRKYLTLVGIRCGYTVVKTDIAPALKKLSEILTAAAARGRRKYVRATADNDALTAINIPHDGDYIKGTIRDISAVGLSCVFSRDPELEKNSLCQNIQIKLQGMILKTEGIVFGSRMEEDAKIYVLLFTKRMDPEARTRIRKFVQSSLQGKIDALMK
jgi:hypothetical protein